MTSVMAAIVAALNLAANYVPDAFKGILALAASLIGQLNLFPSDPRVGRIAGLVAQLIEEMDAALELTDDDLRESARLMLENKFLHGWAVLVTQGGE